MKLLAAALLVFAVVNVWSASVVQFRVEDEIETEVMEIFMKQHPRKPSQLSTFRYVDCGNPGTDILHITSLEITPDPLSFPGTLIASFTGTIKSTVDAPLKVDVIMSRKVGSTWIKIPCISQIGSCTYDDLCNTLNGATCPSPFVTAKIPCKCPFSAGTYKMQKGSFAVDAAVFPAGDYHFTGNMTNGNKHVGCVELYASFE